MPEDQDDEMPDDDNAYASNALRERLRDEIARRTMSQKEAAEAIGTTQQTLSRWLSGQLVPSRDVLPNVARFLHVSLREVRAMYAAASRAGRRRSGATDLEERIGAVERAHVSIVNRLGEIARELQGLHALLEQTSGRPTPPPRSSRGGRSR